MSFTREGEEPPAEIARRWRGPRPRGEHHCAPHREASQVHRTVEPVELQSGPAGSDGGAVARLNGGRPSSAKRGHRERRTSTGKQGEQDARMEKEKGGAEGRSPRSGVLR
jgi:hypothetical protein